MDLLGFHIGRTAKSANASVPVATGGAWWGTVRESFAGAWQKNVEIRPDLVLTYSAVYACISLIAADIGKLHFRLVAIDENDIWTPVFNPAFSPVLRRPNHYQNRIKFIEQWVTSKLIHGNAYILKQRDNRGIVNALYPLDPRRVIPKVAPDGEVYYQLNVDILSELPDSVTVPASEIIHDTMIALYHPLVGVSPLAACGLAAMQGMAIQNHSAKFFNNGAKPGGILSAPGLIPAETAERLKASWQENYSGENTGKVAVLGSGLTYQPLMIDAVASQMIEQLNWTGHTIASAFHVPPFMIGIESTPLRANIELINQQYYSQCLQTLIECIEIGLDEGLELPKPFGTEADIDALLRMDTASMVKAEVEAVGGGIKSPNEARKRLGLKPTAGGETPYLQQQNFSLAALNERDRNKPFAKAAIADPATEATAATATGNDQPPVAATADATAQRAMEIEQRAAILEIREGFADVQR